MREEKILIVEDERIIALDLKKRLERFGYPSPEIVSTGEDAVSAAASYAPDIILMDIMLGGETDGIDAAKTIQKEYNIPVIFLTAYSNEQTLDRAKEAEPYGYILKPFKERELYTTIDIALYKFKLNSRLKSQERWLSAILHSIEDGIIATGKEGLIHFMNPVAEKITGWTEEEAQGTELQRVFPLIQDQSLQRIDFPPLHSENDEDFPFGFSNCTITNKQNETVHIEGTLGRITDRQHNIEGQVLAFRDITEMQRLSETINYQASHDALTGLANREQFSERLQYIIEDAHENNTTHALIVVDIDQFKVVNDIAGHTAGDELLLKTTSVIKTVIRSSDLCARLGADEFGIMLENATSDQTMEIAMRLQSRLKENRLIWDQHVFNINTSIGIVLIDNESENLHSVLAAADDACFVAKDAGGNKIRVYNYNESLYHQRRGEMQWISHLTQALEENRFVLYYQPIVSLDGQDTDFKSEILIRMVDTEGNIVSPADFIPAAERYNLMTAIDRWVIQSAFRSYKLLADKMGLDKINYTFTINLSSAFLADENSLDFLVYEFEEFDIPPQNFCFEITETAAISNMKMATTFISEIKKTGATFALDDFGSGFSSFNYLRQLPVDYLKIDGTFVKNMHEDHISHAMVEAIHSLGRFIGIKTIAEFAANEEILDGLKKIGVHYAQGYHLGKPSSLQAFIDDETSPSSPGV